MARYKYRGVVLDHAGNAISGADISVYLAGTATVATVHATEVSADTLNTTPQVSTDSNGYYEFWVDDGEYDTDQRFKINIASGSLSFEEDEVFVFPKFAINALNWDNKGLNYLKNSMYSGELFDDWYYEISYDVNDNPEVLTFYEDNTKSVQLGTITHTWSGGLKTQTVVDFGGAVQTITYTYDVDDNLESVDSVMS